MEKFVINKKKETQRKRGAIDHLNQHLARIQRFVNDIGFECKTQQEKSSSEKDHLYVVCLAVQAIARSQIYIGTAKLSKILMHERCLWMVFIIISNKTIVRCDWGFEIDIVVVHI